MSFDLILPFLRPIQHLIVDEEISEVMVNAGGEVFFERDGKDIYCLIPISFTQAALGTKIPIPTLDGEQVLTIPEGTQTATVFRLKGKGVPVLNGHGKGDLFVEVRVQTPGKLNKRQRELLEELGSGIQMENKPQPKSLLSKVKDLFG